MTTQTTADKQLEQQDSLDIRQNLATLWVSKWLIAVMVCLFLLLGLLYNFLTRPVYSADVIVQIGHQENSQSGADLGEDLTVYGAVSPLTAEMQILKSRLVLSNVAEKFKLDIDVQPRYFPVFGGAIARWRETHPSKISGNEIHKPILNFHSYAWGGEKIAVDDFSVPPNRTDQLFTLTALPERKFVLKDSLDVVVLTGLVGKPASAAAPYGDSGFSILVSALEARPGTQFNLQRKSLFQTIEALRDDLRIVEQGDESGIVKLELSGPDPEKIVVILNNIADTYIKQNRNYKVQVVQENLNFLEEKLPAVKTDLETYESELNVFRLDRGSVDLTLETESTLSRIVAIESELRDLSLKRQELRIRFTSQHPSVVALDAQSRVLKNELKLLEQAVYEMPETQRKILALTRNVEVATSLYTALLTRTQELKIAMASATSDANILDRATAANKPVKPKKAAVLIITTILGGLLGIFVSFLKSAMVPGVEDPNELEEKLGLPVSATIPHSKLQKKISRRKSINTNDIVALAHLEPNDIAVESLRNLRTALFYSQGDEKNNIVLITSASPKVGKSFVSLNLAIILANSGKKVLLIDGDMRKGHLHRAFSAPQKPGLSMALQQDVMVEEIVEETKIENLSFIPTGEHPTNPSELLLTNRFAALMTILSLRYDHVILDAAPVLAAADAGIMARLAGATLVVVKSGVNPLREIEQCTKRLMQNSANLQGVIVNDIMMTGKSKSYGGYVYQYTSAEA